MCVTAAAFPMAFPPGPRCTSTGAWVMSGSPKRSGTRKRSSVSNFDYIIVCVVTGSTQGGMIVGFKADHRAHRVIGIDASGTIEQTRAQVEEIVHNTAQLIGLDREFTAEDIHINPDYAYPAYGVPSQETNAAIRLAARTEAMITDPVYEGKSMQGMVDLVGKGFFPDGSRILYAHLGGAPALNGYSYTYRNG